MCVEKSVKLKIKIFLLSGNFQSFSFILPSPAYNQNIGFLTANPGTDIWLSKSFTTIAKGALRYYVSMLVVEGGGLNQNANTGDHGGCLI